MTLRPWRLLFANLDSVPRDLDEQIYNAILDLERKREEDEIDWDHIHSWNVDQDLGTLTLAFEDESVALNAKTQILGTFDGSTFMWACNNPSIHEELKRDSKRVRDLGRNNGWNLFELDQFAATVRDGYAMMAFASRSLQSHSAYAGRSGDQVVYFTLYDLEATSRTETVERENEEVSFFDTFNTMIDAQVAAVQLSLPELRSVEAMCATAHTTIQAGNYSLAVETLDSAWESLGKYAVDQEPASWIRLAKGNALFLAGEFAAARDALVLAENSFDCPDKTLLYLRMGQCAAETNDVERAKELFVRVYVAGGLLGLEPLSKEHRTLANSLITKYREEAKQRVENLSVPPQSEPQFERASAIVKCLISDFFQFESAANEISNAAKLDRKVRNETCESDQVAEDLINSEWCKILASWCTTVHNPRCTSRTFPPEHDPQKEIVTGVSRNRDGLIVVETSANDPYEHVWRYVLCEEDGELRVSQIFSVIGDEEFPSI